MIKKNKLSILLFICSLVVQWQPIRCNVPDKDCQEESYSLHFRDFEEHGALLTSAPKEAVIQYKIRRISNYCVLLNNGVRLIRKNGDCFPSSWRENDTIFLFADPEGWIFVAGYQVKMVNLSRSSNFLSDKEIAVCVAEAPDLVYDNYVLNYSLDTIPRIIEFKNDNVLLLHSISGRIVNLIETGDRIPFNWRTFDLVMYLQSNFPDHDQWPYLIFNHATHSFVKCKLIDAIEN